MNIEDFTNQVYRGTIKTLEEYNIDHYVADRSIEGPLIGAKHISVGLHLERSKDLAKLMKVDEEISLASGVPNVMISRDRDIVWIEYELPKALWKTYTFRETSYDAIGFGLGHKPIDFDFRFPHTICAGETGSGKTELMRTILSYLILKYSADDLRVIICDPHNVDYHMFDGEEHLIGNRATTKEDIESAVFSAWTELQNRIKGGLTLENSSLPRILLVIDECHNKNAIGTKGGGFNDNVLDWVQDISSQARKFGVNLLLGTQKPGQENLPYILDNMGNKFVGKVDKAHTSSHLTGRAGLDAHKLLGHGDFYKITNRVDRFQAALIKDYSFLKKKVLPSPFIKEVKRKDENLLPELVAEYLLEEIDEKNAKKRFNIGVALHKKYKTFSQRLKEYLHG